MPDKMPNKIRCKAQNTSNYLVLLVLLDADVQNLLFLLVLLVLLVFWKLWLAKLYLNVPCLPKKIRCKAQNTSNYLVLLVLLDADV